MFFTREGVMELKGIIFALIAGTCITLQGVINSRISQDIGTLPAIAVTQFAGFCLALFILLWVRDGRLSQLKKVKPLYLFAGAFGVFIIFNEVTAIHLIGVTVTMSMILVAQIVTAFLIDVRGWFENEKPSFGAPQFIGVAMMIIGVLIMQF